MSSSGLMTGTRLPGMQRPCLLGDASPTARIAPATSPAIASSATALDAAPYANRRVPVAWRSAR